MQESTPPAITTSAAPARIMSAAWEMASAPEAQALTGVRAPPLAPTSMDTQAAGALVMMRVRVCGDTLRGPLASSVRVCSRVVSRPP